MRLQAWSKFLVPKGWIAIDGVSLTVVEVCAAVVGVHCTGMSDVACPTLYGIYRMLHVVCCAVRSRAEWRQVTATTFSVCLIPETLARTTLGFKRDGLPSHTCAGTGACPRIVHHDWVYTPHITCGTGSHWYRNLARVEGRGQRQPGIRRPHETDRADDGAAASGDD